jgi:hypothetical protein
MIQELKEKIGNGSCITGITEIWKAVKEGRGLKLLVEKDYAVPGFLLHSSSYDLYLEPPKEQHEILPDVINTIIEIVLEYNGDVTLVENNALKDYQRAALITRY